MYLGDSAVAMVVYGTVAADRNAAPWSRSRRTWQYCGNEPIAARPEEQIHVVEDGPELRRQCLPQQFVCAVETRLDRIARNTEIGRRLFDAHLLDSAQHEDAAETRRQLVYRLLDGVADLPSGDCLLGVRLGCGEGPDICREDFRHLAHSRSHRARPPRPPDHLSENHERAGIAFGCCFASRRQRLPSFLPACRRATQHRRSLLVFARKQPSPSTPPAAVMLLDAQAAKGFPAFSVFYRRLIAP